MKDYLLEVRVKNGLIVSAMREAGYKTVAELARACGIKDAELGKILNLKTSALTSQGDWRPAVVKLCECLNKMPSQLFNEQQQQSALKTNKVERYIEMAELTHAMQRNKTIDEEIREFDLVKEMRSVLTQLTPREQKVISLLHGLEGPVMTHKEVADVFDVGRTRIGQIEAKAFRKIRQTKRSSKLYQIAFGDDDEPG